MRDHHETAVGETALDQELDRSLREFHPDIRRIGLRYLPTATLHGELLLRSYGALTTHEREGSRNGDESTDPVDTAVAVELFRAYGLTRELSLHEDADTEPGVAPSPPSILAGDRFLSTSFDRIARETASTRRISCGIRTASATVEQFCTFRSDRGTDDEADGRTDDRADGRTGDDVLARHGDDGLDSVGIVTPALTGVLAVDLAAVLARGSPNASEPLRAAGASIGASIACRRLAPGSAPRRDRPTAVEPRHDADAPGWSRDGSNPYRALGGGEVRFDRLATEHLEDARRHLGDASALVSESFGGYFDRIDGVASEPIR
ncbi:hypothetical protein J2751_001398 [Halorubrum alkaliphilum]|uniref:Uncharacterized protein n=1 Tax=Halorubrum alkaliphilum TaxID=261290 RepID=A0A8T4GFG1_9EURY|nr:hypothetical protein [Halorubrum alkaliphilum]MBP1922390.1 hypothetical protein [Halorubrum alkaliphilum]